VVYISISINEMLIRIVNLGKKMGRIAMILQFVLFLNSVMDAQINSEVGYTVSYIPLKVTNSIISQYNKGQNLAENESVLKQMDKLHLINGFNLGLSYRINALKFIGSWNSLIAGRSGTVGNVKEGTGREKNFYFATNTFSFGTEVLINHFGIGASLDYNVSTLKTKLKNTSSKVLISPDTKYKFYSNRVYLIFYFRATDNFGVELKPYVSFPWGKIDVSELSNLLVDDSSTTLNTEKLIHFGLTFSVLNGFQPEN